MPIEVEKLLSFSIPVTRQVLTKQQTAFYALSVGLGSDPLDEHQLRYVDYCRNLKALPSLALVLGHPGFWLADPHSGVDPRAVVHGEQTLTLHGVLPVEGEVIGKTRIVGLVDKGPGKGALLYTRKEVRAADDDRLLACTASTSFIRNGGGFGGKDTAPWVTHVMPKQEAELYVDLPTRPEQSLYYRMNGDENPLHVDPNIAVFSGFERPILHGLCTYGIICHALLRGVLGYDASKLQGMALRFSSPVYPGETIRTEIWRDGSFRAKVLERDVIVVDNGLARFVGDTARWPSNGLP